MFGSLDASCQGHELQISNNQMVEHFRWNFPHTAAATCTGSIVWVGLAAFGARPGHEVGSAGHAGQGRLLGCWRL